MNENKVFIILRKQVTYIALSKILIIKMYISVIENKINISVSEN